MFSGWLDSLLEPIDRKPSDIATVLAAHLRQLIDRCALRAGSARGSPKVARISTCVLRRVIAGKVVVSIGREQAGVNVTIAVAPERGVIAVAPHSVVVHIVVGERPEQRADPSVSAVTMSPPAVSAVTSLMPSRRRRAGGDAGAGVQIA